ncbi:LysR family transcriptional regulator [Curvibacter sp. HBC28]|uniref:LysR family transcriptional regulator n=1 Tax=Curvibacter microcysteis TaxID=3026419 RepID=A0ABT5MGM7_9BURK|nr:LysR family transcriptional regulator [Curvibacter sp. HBC28]MDD0814246.1 LysR family transcriptional regulator [Curvibacter sp. HBC28]
MERADLELVLAIRQHGSLTAAAKTLHVAPPAVTKRLAALESELKLRLFQRTTRKVSPTADGEALCEHASQLLQGFQRAEAELRERQSEPTGLIRLAGTFGFGRLWLGPAVAEFQARHPRVQVQLQLMEQLPDLAVEGYDGAVWLWNLPGHRASEWVAKRLARNQRVLVAAPAYLQRHGRPTLPAELSQHQCLVVRENGGDPSQRFDHWTLHSNPSGRTKAVQRITVSGALSSNSGELVRDWCLAGQGIMLRSRWDIAGALQDGRLEQVLPAWSMADADIHWLMPWQARTPRRVRLLIDFLRDRFQGEPWLPRA